MDAMRNMGMKSGSTDLSSSLATLLMNEIHRQFQDWQTAKVQNHLIQEIQQEEQRAKKEIESTVSVSNNNSITDSSSGNKKKKKKKKKKTAVTAADETSMDANDDIDVDSVEELEEKPPVLMLPPNVKLPPGFEILAETAVTSKEDQESTRLLLEKEDFESTQLLLQKEEEEAEERQRKLDQAKMLQQEEATRQQRLDAARRLEEEEAEDARQRELDTAKMLELEALISELPTEEEEEESDEGPTASMDSPLLEPPRPIEQFMTGSPGPHSAGSPSYRCLSEEFFSYEDFKAVEGRVRTLEEENEVLKGNLTRMMSQMTAVLDELEISRDRWKVAEDGRRKTEGHLHAMYVHMDGMEKLVQTLQQQQQLQQQQHLVRSASPAPPGLSRSNPWRASANVAPIGAEMHRPPVGGGAAPTLPPPPGFAGMPRLLGGLDGLLSSSTSSAPSSNVWPPFRQ